MVNETRDQRGESALLDRYPDAFTRLGYALAGRIGEFLATLRNVTGVGNGPSPGPWPRYARNVNSGKFSM